MGPGGRLLGPPQRSSDSQGLSTGTECWVETTGTKSGGAETLGCPAEMVLVTAAPAPERGVTWVRDLAFHCVPVCELPPILLLKTLLFKKEAAQRWYPINLK